MPTIELKNVTKTYRWEKRYFAAADNISLQIKQGEFVFVVGSSGAGKSTLLRLACGDLKPDRGTVCLDRLNLNTLFPGNRPRVRRMFGQVWQDVRLIRKQTIGENLGVSVRAVHGGRNEQIKKRVGKALGIVGLPGAERFYPGELSIGQCRRVELARAMINSPAILLLDELTANLDDGSIWDLMHLLQEINRQGTTVVMATHASTYVNIMRRRVITLVDGRVFRDVQRGRYGGPAPAAAVIGFDNKLWR